MKALAVTNLSKSAFNKPRLTSWTVIALLLGLFATPAAWAKQRFALVIGNGAYYERQAGVNDLGPLSAPVNDANQMARLLQDAGFVLIDHEGRDLPLTDAKQSTMRDAIDRFIDRILENPESEAVFYFSGHGLYLNDLKYPTQSANYLLPIGKKYRSANPFDIQYDAINAHVLIRRFGSLKAQVLVILDTCREELELMESYGFGKNQYFQPMSPAAGITIAYATQHAYNAWSGDIEGGHSRYTARLLEYLKKSPGAQISHVLGVVQKHLSQENKYIDPAYRQYPWTEGSFYSPMCLHSCEDGVQFLEPVKPPDTWQVTLFNWLEKYQIFLGLVFVALITRLRIKELDKVWGYIDITPAYEFCQSVFKYVFFKIRVIFICFLKLAVFVLPLCFLILLMGLFDPEKVSNTKGWHQVAFVFYVGSYGWITLGLFFDAVMFVFLGRSGSDIDWFDISVFTDFNSCRLWSISLGLNMLIFLWFYFLYEP